ncbi:restriction endonuclease subunit R [Synechococcales cyanobacterium C]|uniref:Restriction endonuclease subunit R n=1 Tax=Petrachloros mirabilis ULC683 TaxID=2781853 RepID=A0A8K1ZXJ4_9CYAN|nr:PD-(D/E)XK nuclease family protein [Petrachloros mirabilis]NCJ06738.1 restriction endonuclease subunit R [Petrachloros mirabilis ULC683]
MVQTLPARDVDLGYLVHRFGLQRIREPRFFSEWQEGLPELIEAEQHFLGHIQEGYINLVEYPPVLERAVQLSILSPLLFLAGFFLPPFHIQVEKSIEVSDQNEEVTIRGQIDILLIKDQFWVMVIESKKASFSTEVGLAQLLAYMLANPHPHRPGFGMVTTGSAFLFVKLVQGDTPQFATSDQFGILNTTQGIHEAFRVLKRLGQL